MKSAEEWKATVRPNCDDHDGCEFGAGNTVPAQNDCKECWDWLVSQIKADAIREAANVSVSVCAFEGASAEQILGTVTTAFRMAITERAREVESRNG